jgi:hypothetical protein
VVASELPHARLRLITDAGHHLPRRAPHAVADAITAFIAALNEPAPATPVTLRRIHQIGARGCVNGAA